VLFDVVLHPLARFDPRQTGRMRPMFDRTGILRA
jgi:hypothetical protein